MRPSRRWVGPLSSNMDTYTSQRLFDLLNVCMTLVNNGWRRQSARCLSGMQLTSHSPGFGVLLCFRICRTWVPPCVLDGEGSRTRLDSRTPELWHSRGASSHTQVMKQPMGLAPDLSIGNVRATPPGQALIQPCAGGFASGGPQNKALGGQQYGRAVPCCSVNTTDVPRGRTKEETKRAETQV